MNKKLFALPLIFFLFPLSYCSPQPKTPKEERIESALCLNVDHGENAVTILAYENTHGGFLGDGDTYAELQYAAPITETVAASPCWLPLPMPENALRLLFDWEAEDGIHGGHMSREFTPPETGYWFYSNDYDPTYQGNKTYLYEIDPQVYDYGLNGYSNNFTVAWYDTDTDRLYYYEYDS